MHKGKTCDRIIEISPVNTDALRGPTRTRESEGKSYGTPPNQILKDDICEGRFAPGQWLQENELAERLCVSRSPIREALRQLASDGLVVEIPNKGVFVKEFTARDIEEIFDLRVLLEDYAISKLQHHLTTADMQQLIDRWRVYANTKEL